MSDRLLAVSMVQSEVICPLQLSDGFRDTRPSKLEAHLVLILAPEIQMCRHSQREYLPFINLISFLIIYPYLEDLSSTFDSYDRSG